MIQMSLSSVAVSADQLAGLQALPAIKRESAIYMTAYAVSKPWLCAVQGHYGTEWFRYRRTASR